MLNPSNKSSGDLPNFFTYIMDANECVALESISAYVERPAIRVSLDTTDVIAFMST